LPAVNRAGEGSRTRGGEFPSPIDPDHPGDRSAPAWEIEYPACRTWGGRRSVQPAKRRAAQCHCQRHSV